MSVQCRFNVGRALYYQTKVTGSIRPSSMLVNALPTELRSHVGSMSVQLAGHSLYYQTKVTGSIRPSPMLVNALPTELRSHVSSMSVQLAEHCILQSEVQFPPAVKQLFSLPAYGSKL